MENEDKRRRINRYKKIIVWTLGILILLTLALWIYIIFKINVIEGKIDSLNSINVLSESFVYEFLR